jgi:hypothetical protein
MPAFQGSNLGAVLLTKCNVNDNGLHSSISGNKFEENGIGF